MSTHAKPFESVGEVYALADRIQATFLAAGYDRATANEETQRIYQLLRTAVLGTPSDRRASR